MKFTTLLLFTLLLCSVQLNLNCTKGESRFIEKQFIPVSNEDSYRRVSNFLSYINDNSTLVERNTFPNTEVNEGRWTLEASSNFLENMHFGTALSENVFIQLLEIDNISENGVLKMKGTSMVTKYASLLTAIQNEEQLRGENAAASDVEIISISSTQTSLRVNTVFTSATSGVNKRIKV